MRPEADPLRRILAAAVLAPSAENKHYLRFEALADCVRLFTTDRASWADQPHRQMLALLSYGAVVENAALRSAELGYALAATWLPEPGEPELMAELRWEASTAPSDPLGHAIEARHTNRRFYRRARVSAEALARVSAAAQTSPHTPLLWLDDAAPRALALKAIRIAETERFRRQALHGELFGAVRFELGWKQTADEGLPPAALQIEPLMRTPFALLRHWRVMRAANLLGAHFALGLRAGYLPCALSPQIGLILASEPRQEVGALQAGRTFERVWLAATAEGLALQPMAAATALTHQKSGDGWVSAGARARLSELLNEMRQGHSAQPYLLFRLGQADAPSVVTARRPLEDYFG